jgi:hypothetical protein
VLHDQNSKSKTNEYSKFIILLITFHPFCGCLAGHTTTEATQLNTWIELPSCFHNYSFISRHPNWCLIAVTYDCMVVYMIGENNIQATFSHAQLKHLHVLVEWSLQWGAHPHRNQSSLSWA